MTDSLESVNAMNAKSKQIQVRLVIVEDRHATVNLSVFGVHVVTSTGHYTWAENLLFGDEASRKSSWTFCAKNGHRAPPVFSQT